MGTEANQCRHISKVDNSHFEAVLLTDQLSIEIQETKI